MRRVKPGGLRGVALAALLALALAGCGYLFPPEEELLPPPLVEPAEVEYRTIVAELGRVEETIDVYANFAPSLTASLAFSGVGGRVAEIAVKSGQNVVKGQLLVGLNSDELWRDIRQQEIEVELAALALESAKLAPDAGSYDGTGIATALLQVQTEEENLKAAWDALAGLAGGLAGELEKWKLEWKPDLDDYTDQYNADKTILDDESPVGKNEDSEPKLSDVLARNAARQAVRQQQLALEQQQQAVQAAQNDKAAWEAQQSSPADAAERAVAVREAELELKKQQNLLNDLRNDLTNAQLLAPFDGMLTYLNPALEVGQSIDAYEVAVRVSDPSQVVLSYTGDSALYFTVGMPVTVTLGNEPYAGKVAEDPSTTPTSEGEVMSRVQFVIDNYAGSTNMGESARVSAVLRSAENVIVLPKRCVNSFFGRKFVNLLVDGVKVERDVETGVESGTEVEIKSGLELGEEVIEP